MNLKTEKNWGMEFLMHFETYIGLIALIYITIILTVQVTGRYVFHVSWGWIEETSIIAYVIMTYCGVAGSVLTRQNMKIDIILTIVPFMVKKVLMILDAIIHAGFVFWLSYYLVKIIQNMLQLNQVYSITRLPKVYIYIAFTALLFLTVIRTVQEVIRLGKEKEKELGKSTPAFDLDSVWEEGLREREAYLAEHPEAAEKFKARTEKKNKKEKKGGAN